MVLLKIKWRLQACWLALTHKSVLVCGYNGDKGEFIFFQLDTAQARGITIKLEEIIVEAHQEAANLKKVVEILNSKPL